MKKVLAVLLCVLLLGGSLPARADFHYSETSKMTGGTLLSMMKVLGPFGGGKTKNLTKPMTTERYLKGGKLRTDHADGKIQIIDLDGRRFIFIDPQNKTYSELTFDEMKERMKKAQAAAKKKMDEDPRMKNANAKMNVKFSITPGEGTREILGKTTHEVKARIVMEVEGTDNSEAAKHHGQVAGSMVTTSDSWIAPGISGHDELLHFYQRMAKEIDYTIPSSIQLDPQVSKGMSELQKNQAAMKGLPLLSFVSMGPDLPPGAGSQPTHSASSHERTPTTPGGAAIAGLGGLFGRHKQKQQEEAAEKNANDPPHESNPNAMMEMRVEVTSFSNDSLPASLFQIPAGYQKIEASDETITGAPAHKR